jgi:hypothetical protein
VACLSGKQAMARQGNRGGSILEQVDEMKHRLGCGNRGNCHRNYQRELAPAAGHITQTMAASATARGL